MNDYGIYVFNSRKEMVRSFAVNCSSETEAWQKTAIELLRIHSWYFDNNVEYIFRDNGLRRKETICEPQIREMSLKDIKSLCERMFHFASELAHGEENKIDFRCVSYDERCKIEEE